MNRSEERSKEKLRLNSIFIDRNTNSSKKLFECSGKCLLKIFIISVILIAVLDLVFLFEF